MVFSLRLLLNLIYDNDVLTDITSLESLETILELQLFNNAMLSACSISSLCAFLQTDGGAISTINTNAEGCNSIEEILDNCELGLSDTIISEAIRIFPNPVTDFLQVNSSNNLILKKIDLFSLTGEQINIINNKQIIDVSGLAKGVYFLKIDSDIGTLVKRFVKN